jgi:hypothetical protein
MRLWLSAPDDALIIVPRSARIVAFALRAGLIGAFAAAFVLHRPGKELAWATLWSMFLVACPLVWDHYLVMVAGVVGLVITTTTSRRLQICALACMPMTGLGVLVAHGFTSRAASGFGPVALGCMLAAVLAACWLSPRRALQHKLDRVHRGPDAEPSSS